MAKEYTEQLELFEDKSSKEGPVTCLGMTFESDEARRLYFTEELRKKLPELRQIEGFPIGEDEDILALSDPPYYTACPNPFIPDFISQWQEEKVNIHEELGNNYHREPFAGDVSEGKNDAIYNAHSYHTKVPHKAIMRYILHYTNPGDIILDGFCGTGMTGVAAQFCGDTKELIEMGYKITDDGCIYTSEDSGEEETKFVSKVGMRNAILVDISPAATLIAQNYNSKVDRETLEKELSDIIIDLRCEYDWLYYTLIPYQNKKTDDFYNLIENTKNVNELKSLIESNKEYFGKINYTVWSDVFVCPHCASEIVFYDATYNKDTKQVNEIFECSNCKAQLKKDELERTWITEFDPVTKEPIKKVKEVPVLINFSVGSKRYEKVPDKIDFKINSFVENFKNEFWYPTNPINKGDKTGEPLRIGITSVDKFYFSKNLILLSAYINRVNKKYYNHKLFLHGSVLPKLTKMNRYMPQHGSRALVGPMANTLYFPQMKVENNVLDQLDFQFKKIVKALNNYEGNCIATQSSNNLNIKDCSIDYIFLDPPFGSNIMYSELNYSRESWLKVFTNVNEEAIENKSQGKSLLDYKELIQSCLKEAYRVLKPGRWITIEFSNTKASVWNIIQYALQEVGFVIASVDALDKKRGGLHSMISTTAVKQDLVISAYKPEESFIEKVESETFIDEDVWRFVRSHLTFLPVVKGKKGALDYIQERDPRIIYDKVIAYFVSHGISLPISSRDFQDGLSQRFPMRDGMVFLESQVAEYDRKKILAKEFIQMHLFVSDENSAIEWLRQQLLKKPQTRQDLHPDFMKEIQHIAKYEKLPELDMLLEQNFLRYDGIGPVPSQIHAYLSTNFKDLRELSKEDPKLQQKAKDRWYVPDPNKQADLEKLREKSLLREFNSYVEEIGKSKKKLKQFRLEAIRAGFKKAWGEKDYKTIVEVGGKIPENVLQEDDKLLMYYDNAQIRLGI